MTTMPAITTLPSSDAPLGCWLPKGRIYCCHASFGSLNDNALALKQSHEQESH